MASEPNLSLTRTPTVLDAGGAVSPKPQISGIQTSKTYGRLHLLGLPDELRLNIWRLIHYDIQLGSEETWTSHPSTAWDGLQLTCRQIHLEIEQFWPVTIVPLAKIDKAFTQVLSMDIFNNFRRLSLELPFNKGKAFYESLAINLIALDETLEDLRLYFVGKDKFNIESFVHGCGLRESRKETSTTTLTIDGQYQQERKDLFIALYSLTHLHTLVINNANYPLLQSFIIKHKPQLEYLHISTDPRSRLHTNVDVGNQMHLIAPPHNNFPPVKKLHISTNAAVPALQVGAKVAHTIEELNWTVADVAMQSRSWPWLEHTTLLLDHLATYSRRLRTLRLCFHAPIYEGHFSEGIVIGGLKDHLPRFEMLECLELHIHSKADFSGREIVSAIPDSLRRLYISDKLVSAEKLEELMTERYLWNAEPPFPGNWPLQKLIINDNFTHLAVPYAVANAGGGAPVGNVWARYISQSGRRGRLRHEEARQMEIIGEAIKRADHIPFRHGKLGFIGYEYEGHEEHCACNKCDNAKLIMLRLNGRLLDRERNSHLAVLFDDGGRIWPRKAHVDADTVADAGTDAGPSNAVSTNWRKALSKELRSELEELDAITEKWDADPNNKFGGYFGLEEAAAESFASEIAVAPEELPELKWAADVAVGPKEHWLSEA